MTDEPIPDPDTAGRIPVLEAFPNTEPVDLAAWIITRDRDPEP
jgi:hypothetical protein